MQCLDLKVEGLTSAVASFLLLSFVSFFLFFPFTLNMYISFNHWPENSLDLVVVAGDSRQGQLLEGSLHLDLKGRATVLLHEGMHEDDQKHSSANTIHLVQYAFILLFFIYYQYYYYFFSRAVKTLEIRRGAFFEAAGGHVAFVN